MFVFADGPVLLAGSPLPWDAFPKGLFWGTMPAPPLPNDESAHKNKVVPVADTLSFFTHDGHHLLHKSWVVECLHCSLH